MIVCMYVYQWGIQWQRLGRRGQQHWYGTCGSWLAKNDAYDPRGTTPQPWPIGWLVCCASFLHEQTCWCTLSATDKLEIADKVWQNIHGVHLQATTSRAEAINFQRVHQLATPPWSRSTNYHLKQLCHHQRQQCNNRDFVNSSAMTRNNSRDNHHLQ